MSTTFSGLSSLNRSKSGGGIVDKTEYGPIAAEYCDTIEDRNDVEDRNDTDDQNHLEPFNKYDLMAAECDIAKCGRISGTKDITVNRKDLYEDKNPNFDRDNPYDITDECIYKLDEEIVHTVLEEDAKEEMNLEAIRAQVDTGASVSVTNRKELLHRFKTFTKEKRCPVRLSGAISSADQIIPEGAGYLRIPTNFNGGYVDVYTYYSPMISSTLVSENGLLLGSATRGELENYSGQSLHKIFSNTKRRTGRMVLINHHKRNKARNVTIHGVVLGGQYYSQPVIPPDATISKEIRENNQESIMLQKMIDKATEEYVEEQLRIIEYEIIKNGNLEIFREPSETIIRATVPINIIRSRTEKLLWHQRLGHPCDEYLYNAHKYIDGVPKFSRSASVLDSCSTCIQSKQTKEPAGHNTTKTATIPFQGLSIDFAFSGTKSKNEQRRLDYEGLNGETCYVLIADHATGVKVGETRLSKAPPLIWLRNFLINHSPNCKDKYVFMDQGGELYHSPDVRNIFRQYGYELRPTGTDNSRQNGPVERAHRTIGNMIRSLLHGAALDMKFWPYAFYHSLRIMNAIPESGRDKSPTELAYGLKDNFHKLKTFGCRVWVRPAKGRQAKYKNNSRKGIMLGYSRKTTRNVLWYDLETNQVKLGSHVRFDEGMNDLPIENIPPNVQQLQRSDDGIRPIPDHEELDLEGIVFYDTPFTSTITKTMVIDPSSHHGLTLSTDLLSKRAYVQDIAKNSPASKLFSTPKATNNKIRGAYLIAINGDPVYTADDVNQKLQQLRDQGVQKFQIDFAPLGKLNSRQFNRARNEFGLYEPQTNPKTRVIKESNTFIEERTPVKLPTRTTNDENVGTRIAKEFDGTIYYGTVVEMWKEMKAKRWHVVYDDDDNEDLNKKELAEAKRLYAKFPETNPVLRSVKSLHAKIDRRFAYNFEPDDIDDLEGDIPTIDMHSLRCIAKIKAAMEAKKRTIEYDEEDFNEDILPIELIESVIYAIQSQATTKEEQALGYFTRKKLRNLSTWHEWLAGERKQLNQFDDLGMYGDPIDKPNTPDVIILRPHWQYNIKRDGTRRSRLCCNGSKRAAPLLHAIAQTYSSCVEHPIQRLFLAISASLNLKIYGGDAKDAYAHSPGPEIPTYMSIDDAYAEWFKEKYGYDIDRRKVLPVRKALQGHPESGRLWETHISGILKTIGFESTTHDKTIYRREYHHKDGSKETIYMLRQVDDFALACKEEKTAIEIYDTIGRALQTEKEKNPPFAYLGLVTDFNGVDITQTNEYIEISCKNYIDRVMRSHGWESENYTKSSSVSPMSKDALEQIFKHQGPKEDTREHKILEEAAGFGYRTLLGELMYCYVSCRCDVGYAITLLSKFSTCPSKYHYHCLKNVAKYLRSTAKWGIRYKRNDYRSDLDKGDFDDYPKKEKAIGEYPEDITKNKLICFVDAAYGNDYTKRRSTTGFTFTYSGGAVVYRSKAQSITALSSTEAELIAAVTAGKTARFIRSVLSELGFPQEDATPVYEDNKPTIDIVNSGKPTQRSRHIDIRFFAIQDWVQNKDIELKHISGVINPADDLTKPLGWVLHNRHARYMMGHMNYPEEGIHTNPSYGTSIVAE